MDYEYIKKKFLEYVNTFDINNKLIKLKMEHSLRVSELGYLLATKLNFNQEEILLSMVIGLLHDIGRFEQIRLKNTFVDTKDYDHGDVAVQFLFDQKNISDFKIDEKYHNIIKNSIKYHNKYCIPSNLYDDSLKFVKLIRDIDKIDIYKTIEMKYVNEMTDWFTTLEEFYKKRIINYNDIKTNSDKQLVHISFIFDINYDESFEILNENGNFKKYINSIKVSNDNIDKFNKIILFIKNNTKVEI